MKNQRAKLAKRKQPPARMPSHPCVLCGKVSWYIAQNRYYCGDHKAEAYAAVRRPRIAAAA